MTEEEGQEAELKSWMSWYLRKHVKGPGPDGAMAFHEGLRQGFFVGQAIALGKMFNEKTGRWQKRAVSGNRQRGDR